MNWKAILRFKAIGVVLVLALIMIPVGYVAAMDSDWDRDHDGGNLIVDPIQTDAGYVSGTMTDVFDPCWIYYFNAKTCTPTCQPALVGDPGKAVRIYRGIPYAAPPVGNLRWKPPQPVTSWEGIRECTTFTPVAPQPYNPPNFFWGCITESDMSEDVLYLNVATPAKQMHDRLPVLVWFHGGGINTGTNSPYGVGDYMGASGGYLTSPLPRHGVVLVTVQHRIGPLGFMAHPELTAESPHHASGNYGQLDLIASLQWVQRNIAAFGGDPHNITIFGQSGGGSKVLWLMSSPLAKGLFQKALVEAGCTISAPLNPMSLCQSLSDGQTAGLNLQSQVGASNLADLRSRKWEDIINAANVTGSLYVDNFTVDGWSLLDSIYNTFNAGNQNDVPFIIGAGQGEPLKHQGIQLWSNALTTGKSNMYVYVFSQVPAGWKAQGVVAWHSAEVTAEFGLEGLSMGLVLGALLPTNLPLDPGLTKNDYIVSEYMMSMLVQFAATGNPSVNGVKWPPFSLKTSGNDWYNDIEYPVTAKPGYMQLY